MEYMIKRPQNLPIIWDSVWTFCYLQALRKVHSCVPFLIVSWKLVLDSVEIRLQNLLELFVCSYHSTKIEGGEQCLTHI